MVDRVVVVFQPRESNVYHFPACHVHENCVLYCSVTPYQHLIRRPSQRAFSAIISEVLRLHDLHHHTPVSIMVCTPPNIHPSYCYTPQDWLIMANDTVNEVLTCAHSFPLACSMPRKVILCWWSSRMERR